MVGAQVIYPVFITCRDRLAGLTDLLAWLERVGHPQPSHGRRVAGRTRGGLGGRFASWSSAGRFSRTAPWVRPASLAMALMDLPARRASIHSARSASVTLDSILSKSRPSLFFGF